MNIVARVAAVINLGVIIEVAVTARPQLLVFA
jgi:hypothetical protein